MAAALVALLMVLSASGAQWLCACGLCPTSKALLQTETTHPCCAKAQPTAGIHADGDCACTDHGQALAAAEAHRHAQPQAVAAWTPMEPLPPTVATLPVAPRQVTSPPRAPPVHGPPVWLATLALLI